jgi:hypothetical protein
MKPRITIAFVGALAAILGLSLHRQVAADSQNVPGERTPVVVELFTSEGCSSCPPADQLLAKLEQQQPVRDVEIIPLEEHVTYWNQGGWIDPFSSDSATTRQYVYAGVLGNANSYTPQMVVDGHKEFIGSRAGEAVAAIEQAGSQKKIEVSVSLAGQSQGAETLQVKVGPLPSSVDGDAPEVWMAITETGLHNQVRGGENSGQDLHHAAVVREMRKIGSAKGSGDPSFSAEERVKIDRSWKRENLHVVVFVQGKKSKKILGAGTATLPA